MSITEKTISSQLQELIEKLKSTVLKTKALYEEFVEEARKEGFSDSEIDMLLKHHLKGIIPDRTLKYYKSLYLSSSKPGQIVQIDGKKDQEDSSKVNITTAYDVKEAETEYQPSLAMEQLRKEHGTVEQEQQPQQKEWYPDEPKDSIQVKSVLELTEESLEESVKENQQLQEEIEILKSEYEKNNKVVTKPYTLEYKDQELPLICKYYYKTESFIISFDEKRLKELKKK